MNADRARAGAARPTVGFISTWPVYWGTTIDRHAHALMEGIRAAARERGCDLMLGAGMSGRADGVGARTMWPVPGPDMDFVPVGPWNTDGLIIVPDDLSAAQSQYVEDLRESGFPLVFTTPEAPGPQVVVDNGSGITQAVDHLVEHGHRQIAYIAGKSRRGGDSAERMRAFREAMAAVGLAVDDRLVAYGEHRFEGGRAAIESILASGLPFTAVMASNDLSCLGAIEGLRAAGRRVPEDVAAIGFDDIVDAWASTPTLTTVRHPTYAHGYQSVVTLLDRINGRAATSRTVVPTRLIVRESCGCELGKEPPEDSVFGAGLAPDSLDDSPLGRGNLQQQTTRALLEHMDMMSELGFLTARLRGTLEIDEIRDILAEHLPNLGVDHLLVARYDQRDDGNLDGTSEVLFSTGLPTAPRRRFRSRSFPSGVYPAGEPVQVVILPLRVDAHPIGFVALSAANLEAAAGIVSNVAAAIRSSRLYAEALEGRRLAEEASRLKSRFLSMVSHELRTPLSIIVGTSDLVLREARDAAAIPPHIVTDLERMTASAQHLGRLIGDVLDLASGEAGQLGLVRQPLDLGPLLGEVSAATRQLAVDRGLEWRTELPDGQHWVLGDRTRLRQVLLNLLANSIKFTDSGSITMAAAVADGRVRVSVSDTGIGVPAADQAIVFEEFQRGHGSAARRGGLGLGLAIARQLVELHDGTIELQSPGDGGVGTTVAFTLPMIAGIVRRPTLSPLDATAGGWEASVALDAALLAAPLEDRPVDRAEPAEDGATPATILVVDDDEEILAIQARILERAGARVEVATNGREALAMVDKVRPDLVLLDLGMDEMDGFELLDSLQAKAATRTLPIVIVTGRSVSDADLDRLDHRVATILRKGVFTTAETMDRIEAALSHRRALGGPTQRLVRSAIVFIEANHAETLTRDDIARAISISPDYLTDCFRQELGVSPMTYLNRFRIQQARELLETTDESITSIALTVGFSDVSHFTRTFHREVAVSPRAYRRGERAAH